MNSIGLKAIAEVLKLAPPEERLLKRVVFPGPPGRAASLLRPLRRPTDMLITLLFVLFTLPGTLLDRLRGELTRDPLLLMIGLLVVLIIYVERFALDTRVALLERLIKRFYGAMEQSKQENVGEQPNTAAR